MKNLIIGSEEVDELWNNYPRVEKGKCPHCDNAYYDSKTIAVGTEQFVGAPDPHVVFKEISSCNNCNGLFANWNGY